MQDLKNGKTNRRAGKCLIWTHQIAVNIR